MVAWFTVVVQASCIRLPVSLLFPHSGIEEETTRKPPLCNQPLICHATKVTTLWLKHPIFCSVSIIRFFVIVVLHEKQESGFARLQLLDVFMDKTDSRNQCSILSLFASIFVWAPRSLVTPRPHNFSSSIESMALIYGSVGFRKMELPLLRRLANLRSKGSSIF